MQHDPGPGFGDTEGDRERYKEHDREQKLEIAAMVEAGTRSGAA